MKAKNSNNTSPNVGKFVAQLDEYSFNPILYTQVATSGYLFPDDNPVKAIKNNDLRFNSNDEIWRKIINENIRRTASKIVLNDFFIFEWFPRSPGLYHTDYASLARSEAAKGIISTENGLTIYNPYAKLSMLEGGFGNIRLNPINLLNSSNYFMTASHNGICHEGFPIALPEELYLTIADELNDRGLVSKNIVGTLRSVPQDIDNLYRGYKNVPKVYLQVEDISSSSKTKEGNTEIKLITVASSFISSFEERPKIYASYVGFDPTKKGELEESVKWMEEVYVKGMFKGKILTDFDQTTNHFNYAPFSLKKVMNLEVKPEDINALASAIGINNDDIITIQNQIKEHLRAESSSVVPVIFISYNHNDAELAKKVQKNFEAEGFKVIRDQDSIAPGENIAEFIKKSIRQSKFTISIISKHSLESAWVSMESIITGYSEILLGRKFFPVYSSKDFRNIRFVSEATDRIDARIEEVKNLMVEQIGKNRGIEDLQDTLSRLRELRHHLPEIVGKLRNLKGTDLSDSEFDSGIKQLIAEIRKNHSEVV